MSYDIETICNYTIIGLGSLALLRVAGNYIAEKVIAKRAAINGRKILEDLRTNPENFKDAELEKMLSNPITIPNE